MHQIRPVRRDRYRCPQNVSENGSCTMPDVAKEEEKGEAEMSKGKPSTWATSENTI
jgi:hypothetical protein